MRFFNAVSLWLFWIITVLSWLILISCRILLQPDNDRFAIGPRFRDRMAAGVALLVILALITYSLRSRCWMNDSRERKFGFWLVSLLLSFLVVAIPAVALAPFFAEGDRSALHLIGLIIGAVFIVLTFPKRVRTMETPSGVKLAGEKGSSKVRWRKIGWLTATFVVSISGVLAALQFERLGGFADSTYHSPPPLVEKSKLVEAGQATLDAIKEDGFAWDVRFFASWNAWFEIRVIHTRERSAWVFSMVLNGQASHVLRVVETGGIWHVIESGRYAKYRPFEAILRYPAAYAYLTLSNLFTVVTDELLAPASYVGRRNNVLLFRRPASPDEQRRLDRILAELEEQKKANPSLRNEPAFMKRFEIVRNDAMNGLGLRVDETTGVVVGWSDSRLSMEIPRFGALEEADKAALLLPTGMDWEDHTQPWPASEYGDCVMVQYDPVCRPTTKTPSLDGYLLNLRTSELRRLPHRKGASLPGAFLSDRRSVFVYGEDAGEVELVKIDLETGENTAVERPSEVTGQLAVGELSPNGREVAVVEMLGGKSVMDLQFHAVDYTTGKWKYIGVTDRHGGPWGWLPDGEALLLKRFSSDDGPNPKIPPHICKMDLMGSVTEVRPGDSPYVLRRAGKILFQHETSRLWHTCSLDGTGVELYANGLPNHRDPSVSPDETKVLFVRVEKGKLPQLLMFNFGESEGKPVGNFEGFLGMPVWR